MPSWFGTKETADPSRVPHGQHLTTKFPVLHVGSIPKFDPKTWDFKVVGAVKQELRLNYDQFMSLPHSSMTVDIHCVTTWSMLDTRWEGIKFTDFMKLVEPNPDATHVMQLCEGGYTTNTPLSALLDDDVMFGFRFNGADLEPAHGWPLRLVVPKLYLWKSGKWVRGLEFMTHDRKGFWEQRGYHNNGDPWREERYS